MLELKNQIKIPHLWKDIQINYRKFGNNFNVSIYYYPYRIICKQYLLSILEIFPEGMQSTTLELL